MDLTKDRKKLMELYRPGMEEFTLVEVPELPFAVVDGQGSPDHDAGAKAIKYLFTAIYPIRREARERMGKTLIEPPLEMLYWADDMCDLAAGNKENWKWRAMITLPVWADGNMFANAVAQAKKQMDEVANSLRMESFSEGRCAQIMHVGRAQAIPALLERLYTQFLPQNNLEPDGAYHEIYLDDWNRTAPERRKLILRQPVRPGR
ncbi:MAG: GyrI-like domain-containing protein [Candidatus Thiodiazotropha sp. (ex Dulcina madagascariensis)]|nr:GyrI-like domain-containing protein [Candidatus Thiodiazotropha sp. (ex Dulcina madagascariensis)]